MIDTPSLVSFFNNYKDHITDHIPLKKQLHDVIKNNRKNNSKKNSKKNSNNDIDYKELISFYDSLYPIIENILWDDSNQPLFFDKLLVSYQCLFREQEILIDSANNHKLGSAPRKNFIICIPIADRPEHLKACIESIYQLCKLYAYGGQKNNSYSKISVIVIEDSKDQQCIKQDIKIAEYYQQKGLMVYHYNLDEQYQLMLNIPQSIREQVSSIIGEPAIENFYHKGQAVTRNLGYLKALQISAKNQEQSLYFFVDSDQLFQVNKMHIDGDKFVYGLNYFYYINKIFNENNIEILTGKYIGDPPVSPSVMTVNFLDDINAYLTQLSGYKPQKSCQFHPQKKIKPDDAAYHDMKQLFGYKKTHQNFDYYCPLPQQKDNQHNNMSCLQHFSKRLNYFFYGEHLTRKTYFSYNNTPFTTITAARTIYPGNYICTFEGLKYSIPFGQLRLRMSGPTAGRLIQSEIKGKFASVNLPLLHNRTIQTNVENKFKHEFRPGVEEKTDIIDLTDEFERQFFGDLMLFSVVKLCEEDLHYPQYTQENLTTIFTQVEQQLLDLYTDKHQTVNLKTKQLMQIVNNKEQWWNQLKPLQPAILQLQKFIKNVNFNFDKQSLVYKKIQSKAYRDNKKQQMIIALLNYNDDHIAWDNMIKHFFCD